MNESVTLISSVDKQMFSGCSRRTDNVGTFLTKKIFRHSIRSIFMVDYYRFFRYFLGWNFSLYKTFIDGKVCSW